MYVIGLTGQIGAGKSTLGAILRKKGAVIINADQTGHNLLQSDEIKQKIKAGFGEQVFSDNQIDRAKLAEESFKSAQKIEELNQIMWPPIIEQIQKELESSSKKLPPNSVVVIEAPLMLEAGLDKFVQTLVSVISSPNKQFERLMAKGLSKEESQKRMAFQTPQEVLIKESDYVVTNEDNIESLEKEAEKLWHFIKKQNV